MMYLAPELYLLRDRGPDSVILYAPLLGIVSRVSPGLARSVRHMQQHGTQSVSVEDRLALERLGLAAAQPFPDLEPDSRDEPFAARSLTLFLTSRCNLGCSYCYASANEQPETMDWPTAKAAIDLIMEEAVAQGQSSVAITLHGGGEATLEWQLLQQVVTYFRERGQKEKVGTQVNIGTNGVMPAKKADWLARHLDAATVSLDGPPDIHDRNRPTVGGKPSYASVLATLQRFDAASMSYAIRMTVTDDWVTRLPEAVRSICEASQASTIQAEPMFSVGRAATRALAAPDPESFIAAFREARAIARSFGRQLNYSGARVGKVSDRFCQAAGQSFGVTPTGQVSSCYEVTDRQDPRMPHFAWGEYNKGQARFELSEGARRQQAQLSVHGKRGCDTCFCRWHCAGDCSAKLAYLGDPRDSTRNPRCTVNRALSHDQLVRALDEQPNVSECSARTFLPLAEFKGIGASHASDRRD